MKWVKLPIQNHILKTQNAMKLKFTHFPVIKNAIKRIELKIAYKSFRIFQSFYMPIRPISLKILE